MKESSLAKKGEVPSDSQHPHLPGLDRLMVLYRYLQGTGFRQLYLSLSKQWMRMRLFGYFCFWAEKKS